MRSVDVSLAQIVQDLGGELIGSPAHRITAIASLENATSSDVSFLSSAKYAHQFAASQAGCVIARRADWVAACDKGYSQSAILTDDPYLYYARLTQWWTRYQQAKAATNGSRIHPSAVIAPTAQIAADAIIGAQCVIEEGAVVGARTHLAPRVTVGYNCVIGENCILHSGVVIGADGFGFAPDKATGAWIKIEQLGAVRIGNDVEIGANTCIDRGALEDTVLEDGVKLDNLIQIGHNVRIGKHTAMAGCVGVAGSANIGAHCTVGGGAVVLGHLTLADHVHISAASVVMRSIQKAGNYTGIFPIDDNQSWEKNAVTLKQLHSLRERIRQKSKLKGRQADDVSRTEVRQLLGARPEEGYRRDLLIENLHLLNDAYRGLHERHLVALAKEMNIPMAEVYEVATFYHHFEVVKSIKDGDGMVDGNPLIRTRPPGWALAAGHHFNHYGEDGDWYQCADPVVRPAPPRCALASL